MRRSIKECAPLAIVAAGLATVLIAGPLAGGPVNRQVNAPVQMATVTTTDPGPNSLHACHADCGVVDPTNMVTR